MKLEDALNLDLPIRRKSSPRVVGSHGDGWVDPRYFMEVMVPNNADYEANDWEVKRDD
jgi:hypothetical protein